MGRLTLNVLLSFAQLEREVTSERIHDKIAASKRKGIWWEVNRRDLDRGAVLLACSWVDGRLKNIGRELRAG
jgi:DNA invertase Pin-like site-specific DNA recombinase